MGGVSFDILNTYPRTYLVVIEKSVMVFAGRYVCMGVDTIAINRAFKFSNATIHGVLNYLERRATITIIVPRIFLVS